MFKFDFDIEEDPDIDEAFSSQQAPSTSEGFTQGASPVTAAEAAPFCEYSLHDLLKTLPETISFSPVCIYLPSGETLNLSRRDLFDARFQLIASSSQSQESTEKEPDDLQFVEAPSDLIPGVYEGGLKTWECSVDLAGYMHELLKTRPEHLTGEKAILELGCGTALPSISLLHAIFQKSPDDDRRTSVHLQDYNELVFRLTVVPNLILAWYMSPAAEAFRSSVSVSTSDEDAYPPPDPSQPGDLAITPELISAFTDALKLYGVDIRLFSGSWENFDLTKSGGMYDIVLTSETIYRVESLPSLLDLMWQSCTGARSLEEMTSKLDLGSDQATPRGTEPLCLVAAKLVYFGVGGGVTEFVDAANSAQHSRCARRRGDVDTIWRNNEGVKRVIMNVHWK